jgi:hypothetical protein
MGRHRHIRNGRDHVTAVVAKAVPSKIETRPSRGDGPMAGALFGDPTLVLFGGRS